MDSQSWEYVRLKRAERKAKAVEIMGGACADCGELYPPEVYDFHHLDPDTKVGRASALAKGKRSTFEDEIQKCVLLCANCHRIRHYLLKQETQ